MIYTKQGDEGKSSLGRDIILSKSDIKFELLGNIDELSSFIGMVKAKLKDEYQTESLSLYVDFMENIQANLSLVAASVYDNENNGYQLPDSALSELETRIDYMQSISPTKGFVYYGGCELSARLDICRSVSRRTERSFCTKDKSISLRQGVKAYLNRLSDFFFAFARYADYLYGVELAVKKTLKDLKNETDKKGEFPLIDYRECVQACEKIQERAKEMKLCVAIAFCDVSGNPVFAYSMPAAYIVGFDYAIRKAYTAVALKMPTARSQKLIRPDEMFFGLDDSRLLAIPGGALIIRGGQIIGGLGISGGDATQDAELSEFGAKLISNMSAAL